MKQKQIIFDIETGPLPDAKIIHLFDPLSVKLGNAKDPAKVQARIDEARERFFEQAALDPLTGRILAIGYAAGEYMHTSDVQILAHDDEAVLLAHWWQAVKGDMGRVHECVGFNSNTFDWPFIIRRSWAHNIPVPPILRKGRYWSDSLIDLREVWQLGDRQARGSLDSIAKHFGMRGKTGSGALFYKVWQTDRDGALKYLRNDVELTAAIARRLGY